MIECKGKNGYFIYGGNEVWDRAGETLIQFFSTRRPLSNLGPVVIQGPKAEVVSLLDELRAKVEALP